MASITGINLDIVARYLADENTTLSQSYESLYKIFNTVLDITDVSRQTDIVKKARGWLEELEIFLHECYFTETDRKVIKNEITSFVKSNKIYDLFTTFRELKLTLNDFASKLSIMKNGRDNLNISDIIDSTNILLLCLVKNIDTDFYYNFIDDINKIGNEDDSKPFIAIIIKYLETELLTIVDEDKNKSFKNQKMRRIGYVFQLLGFTLNLNKLLKEEDKAYLSRELFYKLNEDNKENLRLIKNRNAFNFYCNPILNDFQFAINEINDVYLNIINPGDFSLFDFFTNKYSNLDTHVRQSYELKELLVGFIKKLYNAIRDNISNIEKRTEIVYLIFKDILLFLNTIGNHFVDDAEEKIGKILDALIPEYEIRYYSSYDSLAKYDIFFNSETLKSLFLLGENNDIILGIIINWIVSRVQSGYFSLQKHNDILETILHYNEHETPYIIFFKMYLLFSKVYKFLESYNEGADYDFILPFLECFKKNEEQLKNFSFAANKYPQSKREILSMICEIFNRINPDKPASIVLNFFDNDFFEFSIDFVINNIDDAKGLFIDDIPLKIYSLIYKRELRNVIKKDRVNKCILYLKKIVGEFDSLFSTIAIKPKDEYFKFFENDNEAKSIERSYADILETIDNHPEMIECDE